MISLLAAIGIACDGGGEPDAMGRLRVVTAFYPIELAARRVGGELVQVTNLTTPGAEPHDLELSPRDVTTLHRADLILYFGAGFQPALEDALETVADDTTVVDLLAGMSLQEPLGGEEGLSVDPHIWLAPLRMEQLVDGITAALIEQLPEDRGEIRADSAELSRELTALDAEFAGALATCARREIFTSHAAFAYLADAYDLRQIPIAGLTPEAEPSARRLREIADQARDAGATTIFFETLVGPRVAETVARIIGAETAVLDPLEGLSADDIAAGRDYFSVMRSNLQALVEALACRT